LKRTLLSLCLLFACWPAAAVAVAARDGGKKEGQRPDLSGTWTLDRAASEFGGARSIWKNDTTLVITHRDPELRVTRTLTLGDGRQETKELVYYTDGRKETNPTAFGAGRFETQTKWEGGKVVTYASYGPPSGRFAGDWSDATFKWRLSDDGRTLTQTILSSMRPSVGVSSVADTVNTEVKLVYRRVG